MRRAARIAAAALALGALAASCARGPAGGAPRAPSGPPEVWASFYPLAFFAERLAGDAIELHEPVPAGEDPAFWEPDRAQVARMQAAALVLVHGASFERWLGFTSLPLARTAVATRPFADALMEYREGAAHSHGPDGPPAHRGTDAHTWLDPRLALEEARAVHAALARLLPERATELEQRFAALHVALTRLDDRLGALGPLVQGRTLVASHPAYEYLARRYGWRVENVAVEPDASELSEAARARLAALRADEGARVLLWEAEPDPALAAATAALGFENVLYTPCETLSGEARAAGADFLSAMEENAGRLERALRAGG